MSRMQEQITTSPLTAHAGIDVGKDQLDMFIRPAGLMLTVPNTKAGILLLIKKCIAHNVELAALEATSKYHRLAHNMLHDAGIPVSVINPFRSRQFADSLGRMAKSDSIDAEVLALYAARMEPEPTVPPEQQSKELRDLHAARRQVLREVGDLKRQLHTTDHPLAAKQIRARIKMGERHKKILEDQLFEIISAHADLKHKYEILTSIPGVGRTTAATLIADLGELGHANAREISALAGVAPMIWDSGQKHGNRIIRGGRQSVRNALYMASITCIRQPNFLGQTYQNLIGRGKKPKVALTAVMRKLVILANTLVAEDRMWRA